MKKTLKEQNWEKEFYKEWKRATGERNIVGDLIIKDFILSLLKEEKSMAYKKGWDDYREKVDNYEKNNL